MRDKFWKLYERVLYSERYYWHYRQRALFFDHLIMAFLLVASMSGFAGLWFWAKFPNVWALVALIAQVFSACSYLLAHSERITAISYLLPELQHLLNRVDYDWDALDSLSPEMINELVLKYNNELVELEDKYTHGISFPVRKRVIKKAQADCKNHKFSRFDVTQFDELEEATKNGD